MDVLVADRFPETHRDRLAEGSRGVRYAPDADAADLGSLLGDVDVLVVRSTRVSAEAIALASSLRLVIRAGSGTDTIDVDAASAAGVAVCNVPGRNSLAVAELAFGLLLAIDRRIADQVVDLRAGRWRKSEYQRARGIAGRHVGVVGLGDIGMAFAERAAAFECVLHGVARPDRPSDVAARAEAMGMSFVEDLPALARACDVLSFHVPLTDATRGLIGPPLLEHVQQGTILLNTARGEIVDAEGLLAAIDDKDLHVGIDVYPGEPASGESSFDSELARHPNVVGTHHVGASTWQAQQAVADGVLQAIDAFDAGELLHCVNAAAIGGRR